MKYYRKRNKKQKIKQEIEKFTCTILLFIGFFISLNYGIEKLKTVQWFVPKKITIDLNIGREKDSSSDVEELVETTKIVPTSSLSSVESGGGSDIMLTSSSSPIEKEIADTFRGEEKIALAIAKAESNLNPEAQNINKNGTKDLGIFQLNDCHGWSEKTRFNWKENIRLAKELRDTPLGWENWTVYKTGDYLKYL